MSTKRKADSPQGESVFLVIGFLRRPHGVGGEILMELHTDFPERIKPGRRVYLGEGHQAGKISTVRPNGRQMLIRLEGCESPESVGRYRNTWVYVRADEVPPLPAGRVYKYELIDLDVVDQEGVFLGKVSEIIETGANDVYVVRNESNRELLLPAIPSVILKVDIKTGTMKVRLLDGMSAPEK